MFAAVTPNRNDAKGLAYKVVRERCVKPDVIAVDLDGKGALRSHGVFQYRRSIYIM